MRINLQKKWIFSEKVVLKESNENGEQKYYLETLLVPFNKISRNRIKYNKESVIETHPQLIGKSLNHNHEVDGANIYPKGEWIDTNVTEDGLYAKAEVYNTEYNKDYIDWLKHAKNPRVSLQVNGEAESKHTEEEGDYKEAYIDDWLEGSTVIVPGFDIAKGSFTQAIKESFNESSKIEVKENDFFKELLNIDNNTFFNDLNNVREKYDNIADRDIDAIIKYIQKNKDDDAKQLQKDIKTKWKVLIDYADLKDYRRLM